MAISTTQSIWRSGGGDQTRQAYCGSGVMAAQFYVPAANAAGDNAVVSSVANAPAVILPAGAVILSIVTQGDGTAAETFDAGYSYVDGSGSDTNSFLDTAVADAVKTILPGVATAGVDLGFENTGGNAYFTAGGTLTAGITGYLTYFVVDPLAGQQNV